MHDTKAIADELIAESGQASALAFALSKVWWSIRLAVAVVLA